MGDFFRNLFNMQRQLSQDSRFTSDEDETVDNAATMEGITNLVAVLKGEKDVSDAIADTVKTCAQSDASGYITSDGLMEVADSLSDPNSEFLQGLMESSVPVRVIKTVVTTGEILKRYANGEITLLECLIDLNDQGANFATLMSEAMIPIPVIGGAIGDLVGAVLSSDYVRNLSQALKTRQLEHQQRLRMIAEYQRAKEQAQAYRMELEQYLESYFAEYRSCFNEALFSIHSAFQSNDANGVIAGANQITRKLGGQVHYNTVEEFRDYFNSTSVDIL